MDASYDDDRRAWADAWQAALISCGLEEAWRAPWLDESWRDGNPIFSAVSGEDRRAIRILRSTETEAADFWQRTFGSGDDALQELVLSVPSGQGLARDPWVSSLLRAWVLRGEAIAQVDDERDAYAYGAAA